MLEVVEGNTVLFTSTDFEACREFLERELKEPILNEELSLPMVQ